MDLGHATYEDFSNTPDAPLGLYIRPADRPSKVGDPGTVLFFDAPPPGAQHRVLFGYTETQKLAAGRYAAFILGQGRGARFTIKLNGARRSLQVTAGQRFSQSWSRVELERKLGTQGFAFSGSKRFDRTRGRVVLGGFAYTDTFNVGRVRTCFVRTAVPGCTPLDPVFRDAFLTATESYSRLPYSWESSTSGFFQIHGSHLAPTARVYLSLFQFEPRLLA